MAGLFALIYGLVYGGAAIGRAVDNHQMKKYSFKYTENGEPMWIDRKCNTYINGERVIPKFVRSRQDLIYVGQRSGKVYFDPQEAKIKRMEKISNENMEHAKEKGKLAYDKWYPQCERMLSTEISTGKPLAYVKAYEARNLYRKFYLKKIPNSIHSMIVTEPGDFGVPISKEEYEKLKYIGDHYGCLDTATIYAFGTDKDPYKDVHPIWNEETE